MSLIHTPAPTRRRTLTALAATATLATAALTGPAHAARPPTQPAQAAQAQASQAQASQAQASQAQASQAQASQAQASQAQASQAQASQAQATLARASHAQANLAQPNQAQVSQAQIRQAQASQAQVAPAQKPVQAAPVVPCPRPKVKPPAGRPARPTPPKDDPVLRAVGGDDLATDGLVVPRGAPKPPALTATSWLVADLDTGEVLGGCGPHVYGTPASVQKLLLVATVIDKINPRQVATITDGDLDIEPYSSAVGLVKGGRYPVSTLWLGLLLNSGNDAANTLARLGGGPGGLPATVAAMNAEAKRLGAYQTHAVTPSGLDGPGQFTSAYDLALIARQCFAKPAFRKYALTERTQIPAQKKLKKGGFQIQNENKLIYNYPGALGGKTGFTKLARHSYVGGAERNGRRLVATVLGAEAAPLRGWQQGAALLDWGFSLPREASVGKLVEPDSPDAHGTATGASAAPAPAAKDDRPAATAVRASTNRGLSIGLAAAVAVLLAGAPLLLLLTQRRRRRLRRRTPVPR